jgi:hypothetical protein
MAKHYLSQEVQSFDSSVSEREADQQAHVTFLKSHWRGFSDND